jgi:hypothetical protein
VKNLICWSALSLVVGSLSLLAAGCVVSDGGYGYGYDGSVGIGASYYEPYDDYGGWGPGYRVAPFRGGEGRHHEDFRGGHHEEGGRSHAFRSAPASRSMPSIPSHSGGGSRGGGSRSGGGGGRH